MPGIFLDYFVMRVTVWTQSRDYIFVVMLRTVFTAMALTLASASLALAQPANAPAAPAAPASVPGGAAPAAVPAVSEADRTAYDAAFQETLRKPADPPTLLRYAEAAIKIGDLEGAISALDRLLLIDGDNPDVQLELGVLYFRLGSMEAARSYLQAVSGSRRANANHKAKANSFIKEMGSP